MSATASAVVDLVFVRGLSKPCAASASARASAIDNESGRDDRTFANVVSRRFLSLVSDCDRHRLNHDVFDRTIAWARGDILHLVDDIETFDNLTE